MKLLFLAFTLGVLTEVSLCQDFFQLSNIGNHVKAPVFDANGEPLRGTNYLAELWGSANPDTLAPTREAQASQRVFATFVSTNGYFSSPSVVAIWDVPPTDWAWLQVRVWDSRLGTNYEEVVVRGLGGYGASPIFYAQGSGGPFCSPPCPSASLVGLLPFRLVAMNAVLMKGVRTQGNEVVVDWFAGFPRYQIQTTADLSIGWQDLGAPTSLTSITNSLDGGARFLRVIGLLY